MQIGVKAEVGKYKRIVRVVQDLKQGRKVQQKSERAKRGWSWVKAGIGAQVLERLTCARSVRGGQRKQEHDECARRGRALPRRRSACAHPASAARHLGLQTDRAQNRSVLPRCTQAQSLSRWKMDIYATFSFKL
ncbi:hypothetical protein O0L34_g17413 [Tuta absoluta]|nr:hypothetical protein O0L34_g17413 [Tuta absoluta]